MNDYRRIISYIYMYRNGEKNRNVGFVKLGVRDGRCKVSVSLKIPEECTEELLYVYMYHGNPEHEESRIQIGKLRPLVYQTTYKTIVNAYNVEKSGISLEDLNGIVIKGEGSKYLFTCVWNENAQVEKLPEETDSRQEDSMRETENEGKISIQVEAAQYPEQDKNEESKKQLMAEKWWKIFYDQKEGNYLYRDGDNEVEYIKVCPEDLQKLEIQCENLMNNSFLLHGFYNYKYIILGKFLEEKKDKPYIVGVPGSYRKNEKMMADMFGFKQYVKMSKDDKVGYWCKNIG